MPRVPGAAKLGNDQGKRENLMRRRKGPPWPGGLVVALLGTIAIAACVQHADAQQIGDIAAGRHLAETWCSSCHLVGASPEGAVSNGAPTFIAIANMKSTTIVALRVFLQTPHARMPDLHLSRDEIDDLAGFILSLRSR